MTNIVSAYDRIACYIRHAIKMFYDTPVFFVFIALCCPTCNGSKEILLIFFADLAENGSL